MHDVAAPLAHRLVAEGSATYQTPEEAPTSVNRMLHSEHGDPAPSRVSPRPGAKVITLTEPDDAAKAAKAAEEARVAEEKAKADAVKAPADSPDIADAADAAAKANAKGKGK